MTNNTQTSKVTIVHIFNFLQPQTLTSSEHIVNLIENNIIFLKNHEVEYIILDNLNFPNQENFLLENISKVPSYKQKKLEYARDNSKSLKEIFLTGAKLATHPNIFFVFNEAQIDINNVFDIEKSAPLLQKKDLDFFTQNVPHNFQPQNFKLHIKKNKNLLDRIKLLFI